MTYASLKIAAVAAALTIVTIAPMAARAADLDYGRLPTDRYSDAYEDPRYRDLYAPEPPRRYSATPRYEPDYGRGPPVPPASVYRDAPPPRYGHAECLPREAVRDRLTRDGWRDFQRLDLRGSVASIEARRPNGDLYALNVDRCSGDIVGSRLIERSEARPYAYEDGPRRPYY